MSLVVTLQLSDVTVERLKQSARSAGRSIDEIGALSIEGWLRQNEFADIEFRSFADERHACIKGALQVWQLIMIAKRYAMDPEKTTAHFGWPARRVEAGIRYYEAYPEEINGAIEENASMTYEKLKLTLPQIEIFDASSRGANTVRVSL